MSARPLVEYSEEMKLILDTLQDLYYETDLRGRFVFLNKACEKITGFKPEELLGRIYDIITTREVASNVFSHFNRVFVTGENATDIEFPIVKKGGEISYVSSSVSLIRDDKGKRIGFRGIIRDITRTKELYQRVLDSEEMYKTIFDSAANAFFVIERDGHISHVNSQGCAILGLGREEVENKLKWYDVVHPDDIPLLMEQWTRRLSLKDTTIATYEIRLKTPGGYRWVYMSVGFIKKGERTIASLFDIHEKKQAQEEWRRREESFRKALEASPIPVVIYDPSLVLVFANSAFESTFGFEREEVLGRHLSALSHIPPDRIEEAQSLVQELYDKGVVTNFRTKRSTKAGELLDVLINGAAFKAPEGRPEGLIVYLFDITQQQRLETQMRQAMKMEALGQVTSGVAHDFNNILQAIYGFSQVMLLGKEPSHPDYRKLKAIEESCERARDLIYNLLMFSRKQDTTLKPTNLNRELKQFYGLLERLIPKTIKIGMDLQKDLRLIEADPSQLQQVVINLAVNARDAMPHGGVLHIETKNVYLGEEYCKEHLGFRPGYYVLLSVSDTGVGIPEDVIERIFDPFFTTKEPGKGTGLGLSTVYGIVKRHSGSIHCYSKPGQGTTFKIYFPALSMNHVSPEEVKGQVDLPNGKGETVLVVDDEVSILELLSQTLSKANYTVIVAGTGEEALEIFRARPGTIDLVLLDIDMPGMGGIACLKELRKIRRDVKVIIASGYAADKEIRGQLEGEDVPYLLKPFDLSEMLKSMRKLLDH